MNRKTTVIRRQMTARPLFWAAVLMCGMLVCHVTGTAAAADWPTYRCDPGRSAVSGESLRDDLTLQWTYSPSQPPKPAWPPPMEEIPRMHSDNAFHVAMADGRVFFGSSVTDEIWAIDVASGQVCWRFSTDGPVRFAPTVSQGRVYAGSDDGYVYCLRAANGSLLWRYRPGPSDEKVLGNGRMISLWPVRTSVLVDDGVVYCGAGVFPYEGICIAALNAANGSVVWRNDTIGDRAHELSYGGISPHGYLLASDDVLYVPAGRAMPAAFSRESGKFLFWAAPGGKQGGTWSLLHENQLIAGVDRSGTPHKVAYDTKTGRREGDVFAWFPGLDMLIRGNLAYVLTPAGLYAIDRNAHAEALEKVAASKKDRSALGKQLAKHREDLSKADTDEQTQIRHRIDEITRRVAEHVAEEQRLQRSCCKWHLPATDCYRLILAGDTVFLGGSNQVLGVEAGTGRQVWEAQVAGDAVGLAAGNGSLIVSTDEGRVHCFASGENPSPKAVKVVGDPEAFDDHPQRDLYRQVARRIVDESKATKGYGLVLGGDTGQLAYELSRMTDLQIVALEKDPDRLRVARQKLLSAGLLGSRVVVEPWEIDSLPPYFANLVVSNALSGTGATGVTRDQAERVMRPGGSTAAMVTPDGRGDLTWRTFQRPQLEETGSWTQQYGNPQNTACSHDSMAKGPLGVLWFGDPGPQAMVERHAKSQSPVAMDGRLFIQGEERILALDAYNGTTLWQREIPGAVRARVDVDGGNLALDKSGLYVAAYDQCFRLDPATGRTIRVYALPKSTDGNHRWGNVSIHSGILFGIRASALKAPYAAVLKAAGDDVTDDMRRAYTRSNQKWFPMADYPLWENYNSGRGSVTNKMMAGDMVFALDPDTGDVLWTHQGKRIANLTMSIGDGKIFFAESDVSDALTDQAIDERRALIDRGVYEETDDMAKAGHYEPSDVRVAVALDARSGEKLWTKPVDFTGCCGDAMGSACQEDILLFFGCVGNHDAFRFRESQLKYRRIVAMSASSGAVLWSRPVNYRTRPVVMGDKIIIEPRACDLRTGEIVTRLDPISEKEVPWEFLRPGHTCAITSASADALFYRSSSTAIYDLERDAGVAIFGGIRPGCWINMIPASGLVLVPEASVGCTCSFPLRCSFALANKPKRPQPWTVFINHTELNPKGQVVPGTYNTPVRHLGINFGAPADMKDDDGGLWLAYPNPRTVYSQNHFANYGIKFDLQEEIFDGAGYFCHDFKGVAIEGTDKPWLFTSGCLGLRRCEIPLLDENVDRKAAAYTVRFGFRAPQGDQPGRRIWDIKLQDRTVCKGFDLTQAAETGAAVVLEFTEVTVSDKLSVEFVPKGESPGQAEAPLVNFVEVVCSHL